jgi:hypothetical protein
MEFITIDLPPHRIEAQIYIITVSLGATKLKSSDAFWVFFLVKAETLEWNVLEERLHVNMSILSKCIHSFNATAIKILTGGSMEIDPLILKCTQKCKEPKITKNHS